ncbi:MAG: MFS transporter [Acidobacteria bacterium]|jgi:DHA1 family tetracycline resistance protein-like MFS transporter|nr:MAG: MFS transporter [Acidobacteriota bacterium]GIU82294.1 MAG: tetracycline resistance MFS efflux pump [Pyrinomonadaceae bacterium]
MEIANLRDADENKFLTKPLLIIFLTVLIDLIGFGIVIPLLTFYAERYGATPLDIGLLVASYSLMQFIFAPILGGLSDIYGRRPILFFSIIGSALSYLMLAFAGSLETYSLWMIYASRIFGGITAGNLATAQAYIADVTTPQNRAKGMGLFGTAFGLGFILGPAIAGFLSEIDYKLPFLVASGFAFFNAVLLYFILPETVKRENSIHENFSFKHLIYGKRANLFLELIALPKNKRFTTLTAEYFLLVTAFSIMTTAFAYYTMTNFGYDASETGYLLGYIGLVAVIVQGGLLGKLAVRFGEEKLVIYGALILVLSLFVVPFISKESGGLTALLVGTAFFSLGNSIASPSLTSLVSKSASEAEQGKVLGIIQSAGSLARVIGPIICGLSLGYPSNQVDSWTLKRTFWIAAAIMWAAFLLAVYFPFEKD